MTKQNIVNQFMNDEIGMRTFRNQLRDLGLTSNEIKELTFEVLKTIEEEICITPRPQHMDATSTMSQVHTRNSNNELSGKRVYSKKRGHGRVK